MTSLDTKPRITPLERRKQKEPFCMYSYRKCGLKRVGLCSGREECQLGRKLKIEEGGGITNGKTDF